MSTLETVKKVVVDQLSVDEKLVTPEARFTDDLGADSLDMKTQKKFKQFKMQLITLTAN